jgi:hypothetical protein
MFNRTLCFQKHKRLQGKHKGWTHTDELLYYYFCLLIYYLYYYLWYYDIIFIFIEISVVFFSYINIKKDKSSFLTSKDKKCFEQRLILKFSLGLSATHTRDRI